MRVLSVFILLPFAAACGGPFFTEVEVPRACQKLEARQFAGTSLDVPVSTTQELSIDLRGQLPEGAVEAQAQIMSFTVTPRSATTDLSFVETARLELLPPTGTAGDPQLVVDYAYEDQVEGAAIVATGEAFDLTPFIGEEQITGRLELLGKLPRESFEADVETCLSFRARYSY